MRFAAIRPGSDEHRADRYSGKRRASADRRQSDGSRHEEQCRENGETKRKETSSSRWINPCLQLNVE